MRKIIKIELTLTLIAIALISVLVNVPVQAFAQSDDPVNSEPYAGQVLCMPDAYLQTPQDCLALGPSAYLTELAKMGITLPPPPLAIYHPPMDYSIVPYEYIKITSKWEVPIYNSVEDGEVGIVARMMPFGFRFLSVAQQMNDNNGKPQYYQFGTGEWIWGGDVSRVTPPFFEGLIFRQNPPLPFGWIIEDTESKTLPGVEGVGTSHNLRRFDMVYIYQTSQIGDMEWYLIGPDEWVEMNKVAKVNFNSLSPHGVDNGRWIEIDLQQQVLMVYDQGQLLFATMVSSGTKPFYTRPGLHKIYKKIDKDYMTYADPSDYYYLEDVPWIMYFDQSRALHGAYWHSFFGYPRSHGCVNLSITDARWLYEWAHQDDYVYVWDPSGMTPTDPSFYKDSGGP